MERNTRGNEKLWKNAIHIGGISLAVIAVIMCGTFTVSKLHTAPSEAESTSAAKTNEFSGFSNTVSAEELQTALENGTDIVVIDPNDPTTIVIYTENLVPLTEIEEDEENLNDYKFSEMEWTYCVSPYDVVVEREFDGEDYVLGEALYEGPDD